MKILIFSRFDARLGPVPFLHSPESFDKDILNQIPDLMNIYDEKGFFVHIVGEFKSANLNFDVYNPYGRGDVEMVLISVILTEGELNIKLAEELLKNFANEIKKIDKAYLAFHYDKSAEDHIQKRYNDVRDLFNSFYASFPEESIIQHRQNAKIFVFGRSQAGKTTIIKNLQKRDSKNTIPTTNVGISRILVNTLSILTYDAPGQLKFRNLWSTHLEKQDGLVFVLDVADKEHFEEARRILHDIAKQESMKELPLLLLYNKADLITPNIKEINQALQIEELNTRPLKYFTSSGYDIKKITEAFGWLAQELSDVAKATDQISSTEKVDEGLIFSRWDEDIGLEVIAIYPNESFDNPEVIAINCFSISQTIFGGEKFKKASVVFPFTHLKAKAAIYFDSVTDKTIRGGKLPLSLVIFYKDEVPQESIHQLDSVIFNEILKIKKHYSDKARVQDDLARIYEMIQEIRKSEIFDLRASTKSQKKEVKPTKFENFEDFVEVINLESNYDEKTIEFDELLYCTICHNDIEGKATIFKSGFDLGFACDDCIHEIDMVNIILMRDIFISYGGYFGMNKDRDATDELVIHDLKIKIESLKNDVNIKDLSLEIFREALLLGIMPDKFNREFKGILNP